MVNETLTILSNESLARDVRMMRLACALVPEPGQFLQVSVPGGFLRRPFGVADYRDGVLSIIYKIVGKGTEYMSRMQPGQALEVLHYLGNGFRLQPGSKRVCLIGGSVGLAPLLYLARFVKDATVVMGFRSRADVMLREEFEALGCRVTVCTEDGSEGVKGFVTDALPEDMDYYYACGPMPMLRAVCNAAKVEGQLSLEARMGCGFGACVGCSIMTKDGTARVCKEGPVFSSDKLIW